ncbi:MAG: hypothetical protein U5Q03_12000 [Bacteroidota bacterium]|nr:hypothetical protein [Bacteroidota bacterium]
MYDIVNERLLHSPRAGVILGSNKILDLDKDGYFEITGNTSGPGNIKASDSIPYRDSSSYLMVLNHELEFEFEPIEFPVYKSSVVTQPLIQGDSIYLLVLSRNSGIQAMQNTLRLCNTKGELLRKKYWTKVRSGILT